MIFKNVFKKKPIITIELIKKISIGRYNNFEIDYWVYKNGKSLKCFSTQQEAERFFDWLIESNGIEQTIEIIKTKTLN